MTGNFNAWGCCPQAAQIARSKNEIFQGLKRRVSNIGGFRSRRSCRPAMLSLKWLHQQTVVRSASEKVAWIDVRTSYECDQSRVLLLRGFRCAGELQYVRTSADTWSGNCTLADSDSTPTLPRTRRTSVTPGFRPADLGSVSAIFWSYSECVFNLDRPADLI
jgi:hypothetical protein